MNRVNSFEYNTKLFQIFNENKEVYDLKECTKVNWPVLWTNEIYHSYIDNISVLTNIIEEKFSIKFGNYDTRNKEKQDIIMAENRMTSINYDLIIKLHYQDKNCMIESLDLPMIANICLNRSEEPSYFDSHLPKG